MFYKESLELMKRKGRITAWQSRTKYIFAKQSKIIAVNWNGTLCICAARALHACCKRTIKYMLIWGAREARERHPNRSQSVMLMVVRRSRAFHQQAHSPDQIRTHPYLIHSIRSRNLLQILTYFCLHGIRWMHTTLITNRPSNYT